MELLRFVLLGLAAGAVTAMVAQALVLTYRASGVLNLAQTGFLLVGAYAYHQVAEWHVPVGVGVVLVVLVCAVLGALVSVAVIEPLKGTSPITRVVATLAVLIVLQSSVVLVYGVDVLAAPSWLPTNPLTLPGGGQVGTDRILILAIGLLCAVGLWATYRYTQFGRLSSAVAESPRIVASLGHSPSTIAATNWALGAALSGFAGTLIGPILYLVPTSLVLLVVPALAAAVIGGFRSFSVAVAAALVIGVAQSLLQRYADGPGLATAVPFVIVSVALVVRGRGIPLRGSLSDRLPAPGSGRVRPLPLLVVLAAGYSLIFFVLSGTLAAALTFTLAAALICLSIVIITGFAGQLSLAQYVLAGVGALLALRLPEHMPTVAAVVVAVLGTALLGGLLAMPSLRTRGVTLAVVTLALGSVLFDGLLNNSDVNGGATGLAAPYPLTLFGWSIDPVLYPERYAALVLTVVVLVGLMVANLRRGMVGRRLLAVRSNERVASALGISVPLAKVYAFVVGSAVAALAGVLIAYQASGILLTQFDAFTSLTFVGMTVAGGVGMVGGALVGAALIPGGIVGAVLDQYVPGINPYVALAGGVILLLSLRSAPDGIFEKVRGQVSSVGRAVGHHLTGPRRAASTTPGDPRAAETRSGSPAGDAVTRRPGVPLVVDGLSVCFGGVVALDGVSLRVEPGHVHGLIGPNGAGKTTLVDAVSGYVASTAGTVDVGGRRLGRSSAVDRARRGVVRTFQSVDLFDDLTVQENIAVASDRVRPWRYLTDLVWPGRVRLNAEALEAIRICHLEPFLGLTPGELTFGRRRMVGIARALACSPSVLLLDEPAAGLGDVEAAETGELIRAVADRGLAVLLIEHRVDLIAEHCDTVTVLQAGRHLATGTPADVLGRHDVLAAYLGASPSDQESPGPARRLDEVSS